MREAPWIKPELVNPADLSRGMGHERVRFDVLLLYLSPTDSSEDARVVVEVGRGPLDVTDLLAPAEDRLASCICKRLVMDGVRRRGGAASLGVSDATLLAQVVKGDGWKATTATA